MAATAQGAADRLISSAEGGDGLCGDFADAEGIARTVRQVRPDAIVIAPISCPESLTTGIASSCPPTIRYAASPAGVANSGIGDATGISASRDGLGLIEM